MNRMKVLSILLLALVTVMLAVSCSESVEPPKAEESFAYVTFGNGGSRVLSTEYGMMSYDELVWYYTAAKTDNYGTTGETDAEEPVPTKANGMGIGNGLIGPFSQGTWQFTLNAYKISGETKTLVYQGTSSEITLKGGDTKAVPVSVSPQGDTGVIDLSRAYFKWANGSTATGEIYVTVQLANSTTVLPTTIISPSYKNHEEGYQFDITHLSVNGSTAIASDYYTCTVKAYLGTEITTDENGVSSVKDGATPVASQVFGLRVYGNATTYIYGNLVESPNTYVEFTVPEQQVVAFNQSEATVALNPANAKDDNNTILATKVDFGSNLESDATYILAVEVIDIASSVSYFELSGTETGTQKSAVAGISFTLDSVKTASDITVQETVSSFSEPVVITTYIAKGLSGVEVKYNGEGDQPGDVTVTTSTGSSNVEGNYYESDTGKLVFSTKHFSEYYVVANEVEAYNSNKNMVYKSLKEAIDVDAIESGDTIILLKDVKLTDPTSDNCIQIKETMTLDGNHFRIYCEDSTLPDNARLVNITGINNKDITIKNISIESANYGTWMRGLNLYQVDNINLNIVDSVIQIPHYYALNIATECTNTTISIDSTTIRGWATVYNHSSGVNLTANNSTFDSVNPTLGGGDTNSFGNVVVAEYYDSDNVSLQNNFIFNNCKFTADKLHPESDVKQVVCDVRSPNHNSVAFNHCTFEDLSTPQYLMLAIDTVFEDDLDTRRGMLRTSHIYIDQEEITEENDILNSYIDWYFDEDKEDGIMDLCKKTYIINPIPYLDGEIISSSENTCTVKMEQSPEKQYVFTSEEQSNGTWKLTCVVQ